MTWIVRPTIYGPAGHRQTYSQAQMGKTAECSSRAVTNPCWNERSQCNLTSCSLTSDFLYVI